MVRGGEPLQNLADQLTLFKPWRADYAPRPHITASPGVKKLYTPLQSRMQNDALKTYDNLMTA